MMVGGPQGLFLVVLVLSRTFALPQPPVSSDDVSDYEDESVGNIFLRQTRKHARPMFYINCGYRDLCYCYSKITRHHYCCSCDVGACFPGSAQVATSPSTYTTMNELKTGDEVLAVDDSGKVVTSPVLGFMDRRPNERSLYVTLHTAIGRNLTLSPNHVLFKSAPNSSHPISAFGSDINIGDVIFSVNKTGLELTKVVAIEHNIMQGAYVPLTKEGTLVVDGTLASCYASYSHSLAHSFLAPARLFPILLWPRPGFTSNLGIVLTNIVNSVTENSLELLKSFFEETKEIDGDAHAAVVDEFGAITPYGESMGHHSHVKTHNRKTAPYSPFSRGEITDHEGVGEAYYISFVKLIGLLLFRDQKAFSQVMQVNPEPRNWKGMSQLFTFTNTFADMHSALLDMMPRSW